jgi:hypothetical protein
LRHLTKLCRKVVTGRKPKPRESNSKLRAGFSPATALRKRTFASPSAASTATFRRFGRISLRVGAVSHMSRWPASKVIPVILPPGRERLLHQTNFHRCAHGQEYDGEGASDVLCRHGTDRSPSNQ